MNNGKFKLSMTFYFLLVVFLFPCCEPDTDSSNEPVSGDYRDAIQLAVGNFWVFEVTRTDFKTGKTIKLDDEVIQIIDTTRLFGEKVFFMVGPTYHWEHGLVDSAGYLMDFYTREVLFSGVNLGETLYENEEVHVSMTNIDSIINVPVGTFKTVNYKRVSKRSNTSASHLYAKGIGLVKQVYVAKDFKEEHNLVRYNINDPG